MGRWTEYNKGWDYWTDKQKYQMALNILKLSAAHENSKYRELRQTKKQAMKQLKKEKPRLTVSVNLRIDESLKAFITTEAMRYEQTPSEFIRSIITQYQTTLTDVKRGE